MSDSGIGPGIHGATLPSSAMTRAVSALYVPRSFGLLLLVSIVLGALYALTMLPLSMIRGTGEFWKFPEGIIGGGEADTVDIIVGYLYLVKSPWTLPVLFVPNLGSPIGTNVFWLGVVPWVSLTGKIVHSLTGMTVNPYGFYSFACLALSGAAMTTLLAVAGQRGLIAAIAGTAIAEATPYLLFRWGHIPILGQFWIILGLALYLAAVRRPRDGRIAVAWLVVLSLVFLTDSYFFVMLGSIWAAALVQRRLCAKVSNSRFVAEAASAIAIIVGLALVMGIISEDLASAGTPDYGIYSMNLASPFLPQMSGLISPLAHYRVGMNSQYEGFAYLGAGVLLLLAISFRGCFAWLRRSASSHIVLICVLISFAAFALSNRVYLGSHLLVGIPLSDRVAHVFGAFRSSGRFFWPVGYALAAGSIVLVLRRFKPALSLTMLAIAGALQIIDVEPLREAVAASASHSVPPVFDRSAAAAIVARAQAVMIYPSFGCVDHEIATGSTPRSQRDLLRQANMELQFITARTNLPINSVYSARVRADCGDELASKAQALRRGTLYVYLTGFTPRNDQLDGHSPNDVCSTLDWLHYCLIPDRPPNGRSD